MGYFHIRLLAHIYEGVLFLGVDLPDFKCILTQSFPWDGCNIKTGSQKKSMGMSMHFKSGLDRRK